jgi:hypothetical protein
VLREPAEDPRKTVEYVLLLTPCLPASILTVRSIVAIHGIGAHPDDSWCKNVGTKDTPRWVNWLVQEEMLPALAPNARIMRYGYQSHWFGEAAMRQTTSTVAQRLLSALKRKRKVQVFSECLLALLTRRWLPGVSVPTTYFHRTLFWRIGRTEGKWAPLDQANQADA